MQLKYFLRHKGVQEKIISATAISVWTATCKKYARLCFQQDLKDSSKTAYSTSNINDVVVSLESSRSFQEALKWRKTFLICGFIYSQRMKCCLEQNFETLSIKNFVQSVFFFPHNYWCKTVDCLWSNNSFLLDFKFSFGYSPSRFSSLFLNGCSKNDTQPLNLCFSIGFSFYVNVQRVQHRFYYILQDIKLVCVNSIVTHSTQDRLKVWGGGLCGFILQLSSTKEQKIKTWDAARINCLQSSTIIYLFACQNVSPDFKKKTWKNMKKSRVKWEWVGMGMPPGSEFWIPNKVRYFICGLLNLQVFNDKIEQKLWSNYKLRHNICG